MESILEGKASGDIVPRIVPKQLLPLALVPSQSSLKMKMTRMKMFKYELLTIGNVSPILEKMAFASLNLNA